MVSKVDGPKLCLHVSIKVKQPRRCEQIVQFTIDLPFPLSIFFWGFVQCTVLLRIAKLLETFCPIANKVGLAALMTFELPRDPSCSQYEKDAPPRNQSD